LSDDQDKAADEEIDKSPPEPVEEHPPAEPKETEKAGDGRVVVALDAMGGDNAPEAIVEGAVQALEVMDDLKIVLVGNEEVVKDELAKWKYDERVLDLRHADQVINMDESPSSAVRKKRKSSVHVGMRMVGEGQVDAFISAGNTGAVMAAATLILRNLEGIDRAAIAITLPTQKGHTVLLDAGANVVCKATHLYQFGIMGSIYAQYVLGDKLPRVGLLAIGEENIKGNETTREALEMLTRSSINFVGNTEAKLLYRGVADVVVCDGFTGNITLKISESMAEMVGLFMKDMFTRNLRGKLSYVMLKPFVESYKKRMDHSEVGGAPLLGIDGAVFISHGSSGPKSIKNALVGARKFVRENVNDHISESLARNEDILSPLVGKRGGLWDQMKRKIGLSAGDEQEIQ